MITEKYYQQVLGCELVPNPIYGQIIILFKETIFQWFRKCLNDKKIRIKS